MLKKISLIKFLTMSVLVFTLFTVLILVGFEIFTEIRSFHRHSNAIRKEYTASQKEIIKSQVEDVVQLVQVGRKKLEAEVKKQLSLETENIYSITEFLYHQNLVNKKDVVLCALSRLMENLNDIDLCILDNSDQPVEKYTKNGASYFNDKTFIEFISQKNEGFHTFHFPNKNKNDTTERFLQITRFEPFNWIFCVATDKSEQEKKLQQNLLSRIGKIRYGPADVGYIFVVSYDGIVLMNDIQKNIIGQNIWEHTDPSGIKVTQEEKKIAETTGGDYFEYGWQKPITQEVVPKLSFIKGIQDWGWIVGTGAYLEDIDRYIAEREKILRGNLVWFGSIFLFFMICFVIFISYGFSRLNRRVSSDLNLLIDFLRTAVKEQQPIDRKKIKFSEFDEISAFANEMLSEKMALLQELNSKKEKLEENEKKYRELFDNSPLGVFRTTPEGKILTGNSALAKIYGLKSPSELVEKTADEFYKNREDREQMLNALKEKGELIDFVNMLQKINGEEVVVVTHYKATFDDTGNLKFIEGIVEDITEKMAKEKQINKLSTAVEQSPSVVVIADLEGNVEYVNPKFTEVTGYTFREMVGKNPRILKPCELSNKVYDELWQTLENNQTWRGEFHNRKKNGDLFWESAAISPIFNNSGEKINYIKMSEDTTLQKEMEITLKLNEEKYRNIFQNAPVGIFQFSKSGIVKDCNDRFVEIMDSSRPLIIGINMFKSLKNNDLIQLLKKSFRTGYGKDEGWYEPISGNRKIYGKVQFKIIKNDSGEFVTGFGMVENLTHQKRLEEMRQSMEKQKQTSQRLETIGTLAGGIAHDFNNILTPILGYSGMIKKSISEKDKIYEGVDEIYHAGLRARDLISQILNFSRQRETQKTPLYPHLILNEAIKLMRPTIPSMIEMKLSIDKSCGQVLMDGSKIHQVIINLCTNAAQAMKDRAGVLKISLKEVKAREDQNLRLERQKAENYCKMSFSDTGVGISETVKDRIFDPFFTTKEVGEGTGLGLSVVHGIIKEHDGFVFVKSEVNKGSCFDIYLPVAEQPGGKEQEEEYSDEITGSNESILLVDDRADVTKMLMSLLKEFGYNVTAFNDSEEGYKYFAENKDIIDLVISDYVMPKMSGLELAERIRKVRNNIPILFITGNSSKLSMEKLSKLDNKRVLNKPILTYEFSIAVHELLEKNKRSHT